VPNKPRKKVDHLKDTVTASALQDILKYARELTYIDDRKVAGSDEFFRKLYSAGSILQGLTIAVKRYDELLEIYDEEKRINKER